MSDFQKGLTIFTPTYNREKTIVRLYNSLVQQSNDYFEWLIVDDGSTDGTRRLIEEFQAQKKLRIRYIYKENGGKHTALNVGMREANFEYFVCVDSDDYLESGAVDILLRFIEQEKPDGVIAYKKDDKNKSLIGDAFPEQKSESTLFELINTFHCIGDRTLVFKTELIRDIFIPEPCDVKFFPETYIYDKFDLKHRCKLLRECICICEYMDEGYSANFRKLMIDNAISMKWFYAERIDFPSSFVQRFKSAFRYDAYSMLAKSQEGKYRGRHKLMLIVAFPVGLIMFILYSRYKRSFE